MFPYVNIGKKRANCSNFPGFKHQDGYVVVFIDIALWSDFYLVASVVAGMHSGSSIGNFELIGTQRYLSTTDKRFVYKIYSFLFI